MLLACSCKKSISRKDSTLLRTEENRAELVKKTSNQQVVIPINLHKDTILSYEYYNDNLEDNVCKNWVDTPKDILDLSNRLYEISGYEWNQCYGTFACGIKGKLILNGSLYDYNLNAGGWLRLNSKEIEIYLGAKAITESSQFISTNYCDEEWD